MIGRNSRIDDRKKHFLTAKTPSHEKEYLYGLPFGFYNHAQL
jgi:hypothetical protein